MEFSQEYKHLDENSSSSPNSSIWLLHSMVVDTIGGGTIPYHTIPGGTILSGSDRVFNVRNRVDVFALL